MDAGKEEPPLSKNIIRQLATIRVRFGSNNRSVTGRTEMALLQHLPSPFIGSRIRNDSIILDAFR